MIYHFPQYELPGQGAWPPRFLFLEFLRVAYWPDDPGPPWDEIPREPLLRASEVVDSLAGEPYEKALEALGPLPGRIRTAQNRRASAEALGVVRSIVEDWAHGFHLNTGWFVDTAVATLAHWSWDTRDRDSRVWDQPFAARMDYRINSSELVFRFEHEGWNPQSTASRGQIREVITSDFRNELQKYLDGVETLAQKRGLERVEGLRNLDQFAWLVRFQVVGESLGDLARLAEPNARSADELIRAENRVWAAVDRLAERIGLPLRPGLRSAT